MQVEEQVRTIITPLLQDLAVDLWDVEWSGSRLRIVVDQNTTDNQGNDKAKGIDTETLGLVSRILSSELDAANPVPNKYTLEVSSPGLERSLRHPEHFLKYVGKTIALKLNAPISNTNFSGGELEAGQGDIPPSIASQVRFSGKLIDVSSSGIILQTEAGKKEVELEISFENIKKANVVFEWEDKKWE